jgi:hypothetical protein
MGGIDQFEHCLWTKYQIEQGSDEEIESIEEASQTARTDTEVAMRQESRRMGRVWIANIACWGGGTRNIALFGIALLMRSGWEWLWRWDLLSDGR